MTRDYLLPPVVSRIDFPGRAGALQQAKATTALVAELGDNYARYHDFLVAEFDRLGGFPEPPTDPRDMSAYLEKSALIDSLASTEIALRQFRAARMGLGLGGSVGGVWPGSVMDSKGRPVSAETLHGKGNSSSTP